MLRAESRKLFLAEGRKTKAESYFLAESKKTKAESYCRNRVDTTSKEYIENS